VALISLQSVGVSFGVPLLLAGVSLKLEAGDRP
jgi:hypothetical protein